MKINTQSKIPKHLQTANVLRRRIRTGRYTTGAKLPTVRRLGAELGVSINVVQRALRVLEQDGVVEPQHGVGVRVLPGDSVRRTPLTFGLVYPIPTSSPFAGSIHRITEAAIDVRRNYCIIKSSDNEPAQERLLVEQFIANGIEGLLLWPCEGAENVAFYRETAGRIPMVFVDRTFDDVPVPSVTLDNVAAGRDIILHLAGRGHRKNLILECPMEISSYRDMYAAMRRTVRDVHSEDRFDFIELRTDHFLSRYPEDPSGAVGEYRAKLGSILEGRSYEAMFCAHDEFIDHVYACTDLSRRYPLTDIVSQTNTFPSQRSLAFYELSVREWISDFEGMIRRAGDLLHDRVFLKSRAQGRVHIKPTNIVRTSDAMFKKDGTERLASADDPR
ncbi:MAG: GntR family transcriptional regulator [Phycisphaerae bacterium]|nr:GntR family transcriptional regulator [Phycisphaerae bacterium]